ncbi:MAG: HIT family protein, partial [Anaerolineales bacterium]
LFVSHTEIPENKERVYLGALLIEPKRHAAAFEDLNDEEAKAIGLATSRIARALKAATQADHIYVYRLGHHVDHLHVWVVARYPGTPKEYWGWKVDEWPEAPIGGEKEIAELCDRVRQELETQ